MKDPEGLLAQTWALSQSQSLGSIVCSCWWCPDRGKGQGPAPCLHPTWVQPLLGLTRPAVHRSGSTPPLCRKPAGSACCVTLGCRVRLCKVKVSHFLPGASPGAGSLWPLPAPSPLARAWRWQAGAPQAKCSP